MTRAARLDAAGAQGLPGRNNVQRNVYFLEDESIFEQTPGIFW